MKAFSKQTILLPIVIVCGFTAVFFLSGFLEKNRPALPEGYEDEDLSVQGGKLKNYSLGFEGLIADWYWMKSLQYIGDKFLNSNQDINLDDLKPLNPRLLYPYLDNATTLDPKFLSVFDYGAMVLPAIDAQQAIRLSEKAIENNPNKWRLYHNLGFIYWRLGEYEKASEVYAAGAKIEGAPNWMLLMVAKTKTDGGSRDTARAIYEQMFSESQDAQVKNVASLRLMQLDSLDERDAIQKTLDEFKLKNNRCPNSFQEIFPLLKNSKLNFRVDKANNLNDPGGAPYVLDEEKCAVKLDEEKTKIPLH